MAIKSLIDIDSLKKATTEGTCWIKNGICKGCLYLPMCNAVQSLVNTSKELALAIVRNLIALDTSRDVKEGLAPEVYLTNKQLYKQLTGIEYSFSDAYKRFNIGDYGAFQRECKAQGDSIMKVCSFCGKSEDQVGCMITSPNADICSDCVLMCMAILLEEFLKRVQIDGKQTKVKDQD